jgi:L-ascorbate metabolism protein UlaG (beta-lactamase superfamily)
MGPFCDSTSMPQGARPNKSVRERPAYSGPMRVTKYEHAAQVVEESGRKLIIDPGGFTRLLADIAEVEAVVVTHEHPDHWTTEQLTALLATNHGIPIFAPTGAATAISAAGFSVKTIADGDTVEVGPFTLTFAGTTHATIHSSIPVIDNTGVLVNGSLFYPGDAFFVPDFPVDVLALPIGAPWLKISEAMDYVTAVKPARAYPVHERTISEIGFGMHTDRVSAMTAAIGARLIVLQPGESLDL